MAEDFTDLTIANLKAIAMVQKGCKLGVRKGQLCVDGGGYLQFVRRFLQNDSRDLAMMYVRQTVMNAIRIVRAELESPEPSAWLLARMLEEFRSASTGMQNLKVAYAGDSVIVTNLDVLLERMNATVGELCAAAPRPTPS